MEQAQNPMYNLLVNEMPKKFHDYIALTKVESLRYPSLYKQLQSAYRSFSMFVGNFKNLGELVNCLGEEDPKAIAKAEKVAEQAKVVAAKLDKIGSRYQSELDAKVSKYMRQMDEQYDAFGLHMTGNLFNNIKEGKVTVPKKDPMGYKNPRNFEEEFGGAREWAGLFLVGTAPLDNFEAIRKIMDNYDGVLDNAYKLWKATKDTVLNTNRLSVLLLHYGSSGKRGQMNLIQQGMGIFSDKQGLFKDVISAASATR